MVMSRLEWFWHVKRRDETENIRSVPELNRLSPLRWHDTDRRHMKAWKIKEKWTGGSSKWKNGKVSAKPTTRTQGNGGERSEHKKYIAWSRVHTGDNSTQSEYERCLICLFMGYVVLVSVYVTLQCTTRHAQKLIHLTLQTASHH